MEGIADRVRGLIEDSGLSRGAFAQEIGLDDSKLSKSLSGVRKFSSTDLAYIADFCQVTVDWLITGQDTALTAAARTTSGNARMAAERADEYTVMRDDLASLGYPQPWQPLDGVDLSAGTYAEQGQRLAAAALARVAALGRRTTEDDLPRLIEDAFGADVAVVALDDGFDGLAASSEEGARLILLGASGVPGRQRFTLAHELSHLLAGDDQAVYLHKDIYDKAQSRDPSEMRANAFAAAFLMPAALLRAAVESTGLTERAFAKLGCDLQVSPSALAIRLRELRLVDSGTCDRLRGISGKRAAELAGRGEELASRGAAARTPRLPGLLVRDSYAAYENGDTTLRPYANLLGVDVNELRAELESAEGPRSAS